VRKNCRHVVSGWCWRYLSLSEDPADRRSADAVVKFEEFALDSLVAPGCVLLGYFLDLCGGGVVDGRAPGSVRIGPLLATKRRCQRRMVLGVTRRCRRSAFGSSRMSADRIVRSAQSSRGFRVVLRSTATSWRKTSNSTSLAADERARSNSQLRSRMKIR
jgi:hypothetical protein